AVRLRRQLERRRDLRQLPPQEARLARPAADQNGSSGRVHARSRAGIVPRPKSLRARLVLGVIVLAALGLAIADVATYASLRSFLLSRTDSALQAAHAGVEDAVFGGGGGSGSGRGPGPLGAAPGIDYVQVRTLSGQVLVSQPVFQFREEEAPPPPR